MAYVERITLKAWGEGKKSGGYSIEATVALQPGEVEFPISEQASINEVSETLRNQLESRITDWVSHKDSPTDFVSADKRPEMKGEAPKTSIDGVPAYDPEKREWNFCPLHPQEEIWHTSERTGKKYQLCPICNEFLQKDGSRKQRKKKPPKR